MSKRTSYPTSKSHTQINNPQMLHKGNHTLTQTKTKTKTICQIHPCTTPTHHPHSHTHTHTPDGYLWIVTYPSVGKKWSFLIRCQERLFGSLEYFAQIFHSQRNRCTSRIHSRPWSFLELCRSSNLEKMGWTCITRLIFLPQCGNRPIYRKKYGIDNSSPPFCSHNPEYERQHALLLVKATVVIWFTL